MSSMVDTACIFIIIVHTENKTEDIWPKDLILYEKLKHEFQSLK